MEENRRRWRVVIVIVAVFVAGCGRSSSGAPSSSATPPSKAYATPPARISAAMAYDVRTRQLVMYGGFTELRQAGGLNDTWAWDGIGWTLVKPHTVPTIQNPSMAYDAANNELLLVGYEVTGQQRRNSLWGWKDGDLGWLQRAVWMTPDCGKSCPPSSAMPFAAGALIYDSPRSRILMLTGGSAGPGSETWTWDGAKWSQIPTAHRPTVISCCVSPDGATGRLLALGFYFNWGGINRLWIFDGSDWTLTSTSTPTGNVMMIDDPSTDRPLLVRSTDIDGNLSLGTWSWSGSGWQRLDVTSHPPLTESSLGYDAAHKAVILFGGRDAYGRAVSDTWVWNGRAWNKQP